MKKIILVFIVGVFLISFGSLVLAENCTVARPYYGSITCEEGQDWSDPIAVRDRESWTCEVPTCEISDYSSFGENSCGMLIGSKGLTIKKGTDVIMDCSTNTLKGAVSLGCKPSNFPRALHKGDKIDVDFWCNNIISTFNPKSNPSLNVIYKPIMLKVNVDSGEVFSKNTQFCNVNEIWDNYKDKQLPNNNLIKNINIVEGVIDKSNSIPSNKIVGSEPRQLNVNEGIWFVYEWVERPSLNAKDYQGMKVWCNPVDKSLTKFEEVNTNGNNCYLIPTQRLSQTIECCSSDECKLKYSDQEIFCTDDFKCGYQKSCLSDYDCSGVSSNCESKNGKYYLVSSSCDKSKLDSYGKGKCINDKREVKCCSGNDGGLNTCGSGSFCDYESGCKEVTYKSANGEIKTGVQGEKTEPQKTPGVTGAVIGGGSSTGTIILVIFLVIIGGAIGIYFYRRKKSLPKTDTTNKETKKCSKCGNKVYGNFCTKCGKKI